MSEEQADNDLSMWLSTYGLITAERILERYKIHMQQQDLLTAIKNPDTFYHHLMRVPLRNVLNGIILQQAHDYQIYAQKIFIDYLLSGESGKNEESPGGYTRQELEKQRLTLMQMAEAFQQTENAHKDLIAVSQADLIKHAAEWQKKLSEAAEHINNQSSTHYSENSIVDMLIALLVQLDTKNPHNIQWSRIEAITGNPPSSEMKKLLIEQIENLTHFTAAIDLPLIDFGEKITAMSARLRQFRTEFYELILKVNELIQSLPDYHYDEAQINENKESLYFDPNIGELSS